MFSTLHTGLTSRSQGNVWQFHELYCHMYFATPATPLSCSGSTRLIPWLFTFSCFYNKYLYYPFLRNVSSTVLYWYPLPLSTVILFLRYTAITLLIIPAKSAVIRRGRQLLPNRDDSQITKPADQGSYDCYHRYQEPRPVLQLLPEASLLFRLAIEGGISRPINRFWRISFLFIFLHLRPP